MVVTPSASIDATEIARTIDLIVGAGNVTEIRALEASIVSDRFRTTLSGYFDDPEKVIREVGRIAVAKGIYFIPNEVDPILLARANNRLKQTHKGSGTADHDILRRRWFLIDCDPVRPEGISASDAERDKAFDTLCDIDSHLHGEGWPAGVIADSGNGYHLMFRIDLPVDDGGLVQRCLNALAAQFSYSDVVVDQKVFNPARIWKLYGTVAAKGDSTADRPHRLARLVTVPESIEAVPHELLQALAAEAGASDQARDNGQHHGNGQRHRSNGQFDLADFIQRHGLDVDGPTAWKGSGRKWTFRKSPMCDHHGDGPYVAEQPSGAITAGCHHASCSWRWPDLRYRFEPPTGRANTQGRADTNAGFSEKTDNVSASAPSTVEPYTSFPIDALPEPLADFVSAVASAQVCDPAFVALPLLCGMAGAVGATRWIRPNSPLNYSAFGVT